MKGGSYMCHADYCNRYRTSARRRVARAAFACPLAPHGPHPFDRHQESAPRRVGLLRPVWAVSLPLVLSLCGAARISALRPL